MPKTAITIGKLYGKKKLIMLLTAIFGLLSSVIVVVTYYGQNVGSFSIKLDNALTDRQIAISSDKEFAWFDSRLEAASCENATVTSYRFIRPEAVKANDGNYFGTNNAYVGYTFYMKNMGTDAVDIEEYINVSKSTKNLDQVSWIWYFEDDELDGKVYKKEDTLIPEGWDGYLPDYPQTINFLDDSQVAINQITNFLPGQVKKFTIIIWMEALDPDLSDANSGGLINFSVDFTVKDDAI